MLCPTAQSAAAELWTNPKSPLCPSARVVQHVTENTIQVNSLHFFFHFIRTDSCMNVHQCTANVHFAMESLGAGESWSFRQAIRRGIKLARRGPLMTRNVLMVYRRRAATSARVSWPTIAGSCSMKWLSVHLSWPRSLIPPTPHLTFTSPSPLSTFPPPLSEKVLRSRQHWGTL